MDALIVYYRPLDGAQVRLCGVYTDHFSLEARFDFKPNPRAIGSIEEIVNFHETNPLSVVEFFHSELETGLDEPAFVEVLQKKLIESLNSYGDEKVINAFGVN